MQSAGQADGSRADAPLTEQSLCYDLTAEREQLTEETDASDANGVE